MTGSGCPGNRETAAAREWRLSCCGVNLGTYATREAAEARAAHLDSCTNGHAPQIVEWARLAASLPVLPETREGGDLGIVTERNAAGEPMHIDWYLPADVIYRWPAVSVVDPGAEEERTVVVDLADGRRIIGTLGPFEPPACPDHKPVQHRDRQPPWCPNCGWTSAVPAVPARQIRTVEPQPEAKDES